MNDAIQDCPHKNELHWHVARCKHGIWPQMFCNNCNGTYEQQIIDDDILAPKEEKQ